MLDLTTKSDFAAAINKEWQSALESIIQVGKLLRAAGDQLGKRDFHSMLTTELPFSLRTAEKLMAVAADARITNAKYASLLPPHWTSLHELTYLDDDAFEEGIERGIIHADAERKDIVDYKKSVQYVPPPTPPTKSHVKQTPIIEAPEKERMRVISLFSFVPLAAWQEENLKADVDKLVQKYQLSFEQHHHKPISVEITEKRIALASKKRTWLEKRVKTYNKGVDAEYIELLTDAFYQRKADRHFVVVEGEELPLNDIRHPKNPFNGMNYRDLFNLCRKKKILTQYTNIEIIDFEAFINNLIVQHCEGSARVREQVHQTLIRRSKSRNPSNVKFATTALDELII